MKRVINFLAHSTFAILSMAGVAVLCAGYEMMLYSVRPDISFQLELVLAVSSVGCIGLGSFIAFIGLDESVNFSRNQNR
jgi:hypothetical protein